ncbi:MAG: type IIL restriction-modification enzyme MmeI [Kiritimatiellia bacterium]
MCKGYERDDDTGRGSRALGLPDRRRLPPPSLAQCPPHFFPRARPASCRISRPSTPLQLPIRHAAFLERDQTPRHPLRGGLEGRDAKEAAERQTFWNEFFNVFGLHRRAVAGFEEPVRKLSGTWGAIGIFWPGQMLGEQERRGRPLQGPRPGHGIRPRPARLRPRRRGPRYLIVSDFRRIALHDLEGDGRSTAT